MGRTVEEHRQARRQRKSPRSTQEPGQGQGPRQLPTFLSSLARWISRKHPHPTPCGSLNLPHPSTASIVEVGQICCRTPEQVFPLEGGVSE